ncbi:SH3 domain-containing protein [Clostridium estertheticum]|uniref:SH3 domain-containing protein n=1 Tax=Clostridium estertheticum TaxID=238834 RepID=A0A7Y3WTS5_9CLOT|nr:SH3 domain-containing protein [Clostridium estertheticum]MBW9173878.1 SH3 domain-containing protein [Clostridium estertheticum]MBX4267214.1 SH3 domain-containing protein [Clostridium estertheticum]MBX4271890.1 SH3 domain-containing protein [Clostridium estertheticum]MBZ9618582.1 SH3 domain-containing protein [Clostridium estertheticum subsp. laramiense]MCB2342879.1 SH3 domain-containing protein [Clostridium estertheticum]
MNKRLSSLVIALTLATSLVPALEVSATTVPKTATTKVKAVVKAKTVSKIQYGVTTSVLNVRTGASTKDSILGKYANKSKIKILGKVGSFYKVSYSGKTGYVSANYVKLTTK